MTATLVDVCAYAGTGNVLKVQEMLHICSEHYEPAPKEPTPKGGASKATPAPAAAEGGAKQGASESSGSAAAPASADVKVDHSSMQTVAVLGIALITMGEDVGSQMVLRTFGHLVCGEWNAFLKLFCKGYLRVI